MANPFHWLWCWQNTYVWDYSQHSRTCANCAGPSDSHLCYRCYWQWQPAFTISLRALPSVQHPITFQTMRGVPNAYIPDIKNRNDEIVALLLRALTIITVIAICAFLVWIEPLV